MGHRETLGEIRKKRETSELAQKESPALCCWCASACLAQRLQDEKCTSQKGVAIRFLFSFSLVATLHFQTTTVPDSLGGVELLLELLAVNQPQLVRVLLQKI